MCCRFTCLQRCKYVFCHLSFQTYKHYCKSSVAPICCTLYQQEVKQQDLFVGTVRVNGRMDWPMLDSAVSQAFKVSCLLLTTLFNVTGPRTECTVCIEHVHVRDPAVTLNLACCYFREFNCCTLVESKMQK